MPNPKMKLGSIGLAVLCLFALGAVAGFAQRHFAIAAAGRPEVKVVLAAVFHHLHHDLHEIAVAHDHGFLYAFKLGRLVFENLRFLGHQSPRFGFAISRLLTPANLAKLIPIRVGGSSRIAKVSDFLKN